MNTKLLKKELIGAIVMMLVAAIALTGSTFAWFAINTDVSATGMSVTTKVENNLMIAEVNLEENYSTVIEQLVSATLEPVSTVNGTSFFYTVDAKATGEKNNPITGTGAVPYVAYNESTSLANTTAKKTAYDADFNSAYGTADTVTTSNVKYGYVDYVFYLKAINAQDSAIDLVMNECNLLYDDAVVTDKTWRVGLFATASAANTTTDGIGTLKTILTLNGAENFTDGNAVASTSTLGTVTYNDEAVIASVPAHTTAYYKVTVRLWMEGEDTTCNNETYAALNGKYSLACSYSIADNAVAVENIGSEI